MSIIVARKLSNFGTVYKCCVSFSLDYSQDNLSQKVVFPFHSFMDLSVCFAILKFTLFITILCLKLLCLSFIKLVVKHLNVVKTLLNKNYPTSPSLPKKCLSIINVFLYNYKVRLPPPLPHSTWFIKITWILKYLKI